MNNTFAMTPSPETAQRHGRIFYIMYDTSGCRRDDTAGEARFAAYIDDIILQEQVTPC